MNDKGHSILRVWSPHQRSTSDVKYAQLLQLHHVVAFVTPKILIAHLLSEPEYSFGGSNCYNTISKISKLTQDTIDINIMTHLTIHTHLIASEKACLKEKQV